MDPISRIIVMALLILAVGLIGILLIVGLAVTWRNHVNRQRWLEQRHQRRRASASPIADAWESAGQRYPMPDTAADIDQDEPPPFDDGYAEDDDDVDDFDDEDENEPPWRR